MNCIAYRVTTGVRCDQEVGTSPHARRCCLCRHHAKSGWLVFLATNAQCEALEHWDKVIPAEKPKAIMLRELRAAVDVYGSPALTEEVLLTAEAVPVSGHLDDYLRAVFAVVMPIIQAHADARIATERAETKAYVDIVTQGEARIAALYVLRDWPVPLTTH